MKDIPWIECFCQKQVWFDCDGRQGSELVTLFALSCVPGRAIGHWVMNEAGEVRANVPIHMLSHDGSTFELTDCQEWDAQSSRFRVHVNSFLERQRVLLRKPRAVGGRYLFTIEWLKDSEDFRSSHAEDVSESKPFHFIRCDDGGFAYARNPDCLFLDRAFVTAEPTTESYKHDTTEWICETPKEREA